MQRNSHFDKKIRNIKLFLGEIMKYLLLISLLLNSTLAAALTLNCEAWSQKEGQELLKKKMEFKGVQPGSNDDMYRADFEGYQYRLDWSKQLDTLYVSVVFNAKAHIFSTMRVPDLKIHNDTFLDFTNDNGDRVSISCNTAE